MELWKDYRDSIERNISLQKAVMYSNEKLNVLHKRLIEVFPEYDEKYKTQLSKFEATVNKIEQAPTIPTQNIDLIIEEINKIENDGNSSFSAIDNLSFESEELVKVLEEVQKGKINNIQYIKTYDDGIKMNETTVIELGEKMYDYRIAIDGPSGSGKSTVAKEIARIYNLKYINTGLVYRAIALHIIENGLDVQDEDEVVNELKNINIKLLKNEIVELNGHEVSNALRSDDVSQNASIVASYSAVRKFAVDIQKHEGARKGVIMDGRDTTFKIMPDADVKIFLDTSPEVRAKRRVDQNEELGYSTNYEEILEEIRIRDRRDRTREVDPLHVTEGAHLIDASEMSIDDVVQKIQDIIREL